MLDDPSAVALGAGQGGDRIVGRITSGGCGFAVRRSVALAHLPPQFATLGTRAEVEVFGDWIGCEVVREPIWDPAGERIRG